MFFVHRGGGRPAFCRIFSQEVVTEPGHCCSTIKMVFFASRELPLLADRAVRSVTWTPIALCGRADLTLLGTTRRCQSSTGL